MRYGLALWALAAVGWLVAAGGAAAEVMTGCLHPRGVLVKLALGEAPLSPCAPDQTQVTLELFTPPPVPDGDMCSDILAANPAAVDGVYTIDPDGPGGRDAFDAFCDMTTEGGGWTVVFQSSDPSAWRTDSGIPGSGSWSHNFFTRDFLMDEVLLHDLAGRRTRVVSGIAPERLYGCSQGTGDLWWNGSGLEANAALHLGVHTGEVVEAGSGYVVVSAETGAPGCTDNLRGWGFGHLFTFNNQQGWGWDSRNLGPTVFAIGVR